ncbi:C2H2-type zinc finger protein, partial [Sansalvadorimonas verongulae]|uniref:C2H2-type zinc finger protein n=1 Tax=Sansalvadorimonas verongulae TaxID=2172824 RepID=UPI001E64C18B
MSNLEQDETLLSELSDLLQDDAFQSVLCDSAGEFTPDTDSTLNEVSQIQPDNDQLPRNISGMACDQDRGHETFTTSGHMTRHKRTHTRDRLFVCDFDGCNKAYIASGELTKHKRTHTRDRPFV